MDVSVGPLARDEAEQLARASLEGLTHVATSEAQARALAEEADGVPFFIEELARFVATKPAAGATSRASLEDAIAARLQALPKAQRALVEVVAVADSPVAQSLAFEAAGLGADALPSLLALRSASMLTWTGPGDDLVSAYHDRIREAVVAALDPEAKRAHHLALGRALLSRHPLGSPGSWVFDAVRHFGVAAPAMMSPVERLAAARLHLQAARAARKSAAFPLAFACFEGGIALLAEDAWSAEYDLALALHTGASEAAYLSAKWSALDARVADVKAHGRTAMDQLVAWEVQIDALAGRHAALRALAMHAPINFAHRVSLVEGELHRIDGDVNGAFSRFVEAASQAHEGEWVSDVALARELASRCQRGASAKRASLEAARDGYLAWGAKAKAAQLDARLASLR